MATSAVSEQPAGAVKATLARAVGMAPLFSRDSPADGAAAATLNEYMAEVPTSEEITKTVMELKVIPDPAMKNNAVQERRQAANAMSLDSMPPKRQRREQIAVDEKSLVAPKDKIKAMRDATPNDLDFNGAQNAQAPDAEASCDEFKEPAEAEEADPARTPSTAQLSPTGGPVSVADCELVDANSLMLLSIEWLRRDVLIEHVMIRRGGDNVHRGPQWHGETIRRGPQWHGEQPPAEVKLQGKEPVLTDYTHLRINPSSNVTIKTMITDASQADMSLTMVTRTAGNRMNKMNCDTADNKQAHYNEIAQKSIIVKIGQNKDFIKCNPIKKSDNKRRRKGQDIEHGMDEIHCSTVYDVDGASEVGARLAEGDRELLSRTSAPNPQDVNERHFKHARATFSRAVPRSAATRDHLTRSARAQGVFLPRPSVALGLIFPCIGT